MDDPPPPPPWGTFVLVNGEWCPVDGGECEEE
jgi:hypothetical protein